MELRWLARVLVSVAGLVTGVLADSASLAAEPAETWPQWHGPTRAGFVRETAWPASLSQDHVQLAWHADLAPGYPEPIVAADRVFVAESKDEKLEIVRALDRQTGRQLWAAEWPGAMSVPFMAKRNADWIRST